MKLGFFTMPIHPVDKDWRLSLNEDREAFLLADELGFSSVATKFRASIRSATSNGTKAPSYTACIKALAAG